MAKQDLEKIKTDFPTGREVRFSPGRGAAEVTAEVTGYRQAGTAGTRGHSIFLETRENRGEGLKPKERSVRPGTCTLV